MTFGALRGTFTILIVNSILATRVSSNKFKIFYMHTIKSPVKIASKKVPRRQLVKVVLATRQQARERIAHCDYKSRGLALQSALIKRLANWRLMKLKFLTFVCNCTNTECAPPRGQFPIPTTFLRDNRIIMFKFFLCTLLLADCRWAGEREIQMAIYIYEYFAQAFHDLIQLREIPHFRFNRKVFQHCLF